MGIVELVPFSHSQQGGDVLSVRLSVEFPGFGAIHSSVRKGFLWMGDEFFRITGYDLSQSATSGTCPGTIVETEEGGKHVGDRPHFVRPLGLAPFG